MNRIRPPRAEAYKGRPSDFYCAWGVWFVLIIACGFFLMVRTWELKQRLNNTERTVSRLASWDFPRPMLDICEVDINRTQHISVLNKFSVSMEEIWGTYDNAELAEGHENIYKFVGDIPADAYIDDVEKEDHRSVERWLPSGMREETDAAVVARQQHGYRCVRFKAGNEMILNDTIWYEAVFTVQLNLTDAETAVLSANETAMKQSVIGWNNITVMTDHYFRFTLSDDLRSPLSAKEESLRLSMFPFNHPSQNQAQRGARTLKAVGKPTYHKWQDSFGGRQGSKEEDKYILERSEFNGNTPENVEGPSTLKLVLDIPSCKTMFNLHINDCYSDILAWVTSVLACVTVFNVMAVLFVPVNDFAPPQRFRIACCGLGAEATANEKRALLTEDTQQYYGDNGGMDGFDA